MKDSQRTTMTPDTTRTPSVVWDTTALPGRAAATARWHRELLHGLGGAEDA